MQLVSCLPFEGSPAKNAVLKLKNLSQLTFFFFLQDSNRALESITTAQDEDTKLGW